MVSKTPLYVFDCIDAHCCVLMCIFTMHNASKCLDFQLKYHMFLLYNTQTRRLTPEMFRQVFAAISSDLKSG